MTNTSMLSPLPHFSNLKKPAVICCQAEQPSYIIFAMDCLSVSRPLQSVARLGDGGTHLCLSVITSLIVTKKVNIRVHGLRLPQTCYGVPHVMDTHTHCPIHSVTVVLSVARLSKQSNRQSGNSLVTHLGFTTVSKHHQHHHSDLRLFEVLAGAEYIPVLIFLLAHQVPLVNMLKIKCDINQQDV